MFTPTSIYNFILIIFCSPIKVLRIFDQICELAFKSCKCYILKDNRRRGTPKRQNRRLRILALRDRFRSTNDSLV